MYNINKQRSFYNIKIQQTRSDRYLNPDSISIPRGYKIEPLIYGLDTPIGVDFTENGDLLIADSGCLSGNPKILLLSNGKVTLVADGFNVPITGITYHNGNIYVSHRGTITIVKLDGSKENIINGLPSQGDYCNNKVSFGKNGKMYFGQGTATNSGVVGLDNKWVFDNPYFFDRPGSYIMLNGQNFETSNMLIPGGSTVVTGAFSPYAVPNLQRFEIIKGAILASGSILRANPDGSDLELVAWGFRNPFNVKEDPFGRIFVSNQGYDNRGSRPIANAPDELQLIIPNTWYGWPDYAAGLNITLPIFAPENGPKPENLFTNHPSIPPKPFTTFPPYSNIMGFDFNRNIEFGQVGDIYVAEFGITEQDIPMSNFQSNPGYRIVKVDMNSGQPTTFAINKSGLPSSLSQGGGFGRPADIAFGPDGAMYVVDFSSTSQDNFSTYVPESGLIWKISKV